MATMTESSGPIVFFGTGEFSLAVLTGLVDSGFDIAAVVTKPDTKSGRGHRLTSPPVKMFAERHSLPVWQPEKLSHIMDDIKALGRPVGVLASYGKIVPQSILDLFQPGIINIHPSLLPLYRGPSPIESAILNGDETTGVSIMLLSARMDAGPVYIAKSLSLAGTETKAELYHTLAILGTDLLLESLPNILDGSLIPMPQVEEDASYSPMLTKDDAKLNPGALSAVEAERRVRAHIGFPKTKVVIGDNPIVITKAHVSKNRSSQLDIPCADGNILSVDELIAPSGRRMKAEEFERGYLTRQG